MLDLDRRSGAAEGLDIELPRWGWDGVTWEERGEAKAPVLRGYAAVFDSLSQDLGGYREQIKRGAFADQLTADVRLLINHEGLPLARTTSGTMKLVEDERGLQVEANLDPQSPLVAALRSAIDRGDASQMSIGFSVKPGGQDWAKNDDGITVRTLKAVRLFDVSVVSFPAYTGTSVAFRQLAVFERAESNRWDARMHEARGRLLAAMR